MNIKSTVAGVVCLVSLMSVCACSAESIESVESTEDVAGRAEHELVAKYTMGDSALSVHWNGDRSSAALSILLERQHGKHRESITLNLSDGGVFSEPDVAAFVGSIDPALLDVALGELAHSQATGEEGRFFNHVQKRLFSDVVAHNHHESERGPTAGLMQAEEGGWCYCNACAKHHAPECL
ncbi:hypothetical protein [Chondromyces crocatus]|uniref:hypothetical protein n=1 Tax=Chondromyces crocatus TaxID=52 RepID=UPI0012E16315|nr:hypothetical protein [Chondromyces crocatus]